MAPVEVRLRLVPVAEARALVEGDVPAEVSVHWHPEYPTADTIDSLQMLRGAHAVMDATGTGSSTAGRSAAGSSAAGQDAPAWPPRPPAWWIHQIVVEGQVVGDIGFHGPPGESGEVEIGYQVVASRRGRGIASAAVALLLQQAWRDEAVAVRAETDPENFASQQVLRTNGFVQGSDGVFRITRPVP